MLQKKIYSSNMQIYEKHTGYWLLLSFIISVSFIGNVTSQGPVFGVSCRNPNNKRGECVSIYDCPSLLNVISLNSFTPTQKEFIRISQCQNGSGQQPYVCCTSDTDYTGSSNGNGGQQPNPNPSGETTTRRTEVSPSNGRGNVLPTPPQCGPTTLGNKIYSGNDTAIDDYPWMALLSYTERSGQKSFKCAGSLINQRYVLTAAHCVRGQIEKQVGQLSHVRLGEYDLSKDIDCVGDDCNNGPLDVGFEEVIPHAEYNPNDGNRYHDIALIRLNADVTYTDFIMPVCLPLLQTRMAIGIGENLTVAGWGRTLLAAESDIKQHLVVAAYDQQSCVRRFLTNRVTLRETQLCAGGEFRKDSCDGDSGGPLMRKGQQSRWFLEGVVSFGYKCGLENWPGVYTRVSEYIDWIQQNIKP